MAEIKIVTVRGMDEDLWWDFKALCSRRHESLAAGLMRLIEKDLIMDMLEKESEVEPEKAVTESKKGRRTK